MSNKSTTIELVGHIITLGDAAVGKTCILHQFCDGKYNENMLATIGIEFFQKTVKIDDQDIVLQVWDTSGQEKYKAISPSFINSFTAALLLDTLQEYFACQSIYQIQLELERVKRADAVLLTYSVDDRGSFEHVENWVEQVKSNTTEDVCIILVGNKVDREGRCVAFSEGEKLAKELNIEFFETSAKENKNIGEVFITAARKIKEKLEDPVVPRRETIKIETQKKVEKEGIKKQKQGGCCS